MNMNLFRKPCLSLLIIGMFSCFLFCQDQVRGDDYYRWSRQHEKAKAKLETIKIIEDLGIGASFLGIMLYFVDTKKETVFGGYTITEKVYKPMHLIVATVGAGIALTASFFKPTVKEEIKSLESEGVGKGYLKIEPVLSSSTIGISISFIF